MTNFGKGKREGESPETLKGDIRWWTFGFDEDSVNFCKCWMFHNISLTKLLFLLLLFTCSDPSRRRVTWNLKRRHLDVRHSILMKTVSNYVTFGCFIIYLWLNYYYYYFYYYSLIQIHQEGESPKTLEGDNWCWTFGFDEDSVNFCNFLMFHHISVRKLFYFYSFSLFRSIKRDSHLKP